MVDFIFHPSAEKRQVPHADALHVLHHPLDVDDQDDGSLMVHGPARNGVMLLEVGIREITPGVWLVFHVMESRKLR